MNQAMNFFDRRKVAALIAFAIAIAMLLTGTFAWSSVSQRATNPLYGSNNHGGANTGYMGSSLPVSRCRTGSGFLGHDG